MTREISLRTNRLRVVRACNACRRRKIKCDGQATCANCHEVSLTCIYDEQSKVSRARQAVFRGNTTTNLKSEIFNQVGQDAEPASSSIGTLKATNGQTPYPVSFFWNLIDDYCKYTLPTAPIIGPQELRAMIKNMYQSSDQTALVYAIAAQTLNLTQTKSDISPGGIDDTSRLFEMALQIRGPVLSLQHITLHSVLVSVFVSMGMFADGRDEGMGSYYNKEGLAGVQTLRITDAIYQASLPPKVAAQRERLYWLLFVHDRFHAIHISRLSLLAPLPQLPQSSSDIPEEISAWFDQIVGLFRVVDEEFLTFHANKDSPYLTLAWIEQKQTQLGDEEDESLEDNQLFNDMQRVDLVITRYWLRTLVWQIALHKFALTSYPETQERNFMSLDYPMRLSYTLRNLLLTRPKETIEVHGTGLLQKIFEIACTVADVLQHVVPRTDPQAWESHLECFLSLITFLFTMSKFYTVERNILAAKLADVRSVFPDLTYELHFSPIPD